ncbi:MAG: ATP-dependent dethiobiotin synthetase BioD [Pseudonocardia sp.]|nr:ATP-dependent dethiobiotin synthetase BioD [Pseudonocardia sp.]
MLVVTGTGTGVGKTVVTAALATLALAQGRQVAVVKPAQTGVGPGEAGDMDEVRRLVGDVSGLTTIELARYPDPLAPATAAAQAGLPKVTVEGIVAVAKELSIGHDVILLEGAGGLLVRLDADHTIADVAAALDASVLVVVSAGLGTLNHSALTVEALANRGLRCAGLVIGSWPPEPDLAARCNLVDLPAVTGVTLHGRLPAGSGQLAPDEFLCAARAAFGAAPAWLI